MGTYVLLVSFGGKNQYGPMPSSLQRASQISGMGLAANLVLGAGKLAAGFWGNSYALMADAVESFVDVLGSLIVWAGLRYAAVPADSDHPYGHGRAETLAAGLVALALLGASAGIAFQALATLAKPREAPEPYTLVVLLGVVVAKELLFRRLFNVGRETGSQALKADAWHQRGDALTSLLGAIGISVALAGGPSWAAADNVAALLASGVIAVTAGFLLRPVVHELMDGAASPALVARIREVSRAGEGVRGIEKVRVRRHGLQYLVDLHIEVDPEISVREGHRLAHAVQDKLLREIPEVVSVLVHVEPHRSNVEGAFLADVKQKRGENSAD
jgi:cation diffusion facilitator family transporter